MDCESGAGVTLAAPPSGGAMGGGVSGAANSGGLPSDGNVSPDELVPAEGTSPPTAGLPLDAVAPLPDDPVPLSGSDEQPAVAISPASSHAQTWRDILKSNNIANLLGSGRVGITLSG